LPAPTPAFASAPNLDVIRRAAYAEVFLPDLGRVSVSAHAHDGGVDVRVAASGSAASNALLPHEAAMAADVRAAHLPLRSLEISWAAADGSAGQQPNGEKHAPARAPEGEDPAASDAPSSSTATKQRRVRIVL
jgi:hypothetical protein